jgi:lactoylglutathione lyase
MRIEHVAIWAKDLEVLKTFYTRFFDCKAGDRYHNSKKDFTSYFLTFGSGSRLEIMQMPTIAERAGRFDVHGLAHLAISAGSKSKVDSLTEQLRSEGLEIVGEPRTTGDGYYESVILDPEGNRIEITI